MPHPSPLASRRNRSRTARRTLLASALGLALSGTSSSAIAGAEAAGDDGVAALASLDALLTGLQTRLSDDLAPRRGPDHGLQADTQRRVEEMVVRRDPDGYMSRRIDERIDRELELLTDELRSKALASAREGKDGVEPSAPPARTGDAMRMDSGSLDLGHVTLARVSNRPVSLRHRFERPFEETPRVALGVRARRQPDGEPSQVGLRIVDVDPTGFDYEVRTWGSPVATDLTADWVAYSSSGGDDPAPASR